MEITIGYDHRGIAARVRSREPLDPHPRIPPN
jgi:hypothetical protein